MVHIRIAFFMIAACFLKGNWRNWKAYYPTIFLLVLGNCVFDLVTCDYHFWQYKCDITSPLLADLFWGVTVMPGIAILFLTYLPKKAWSLAFYILVCSVIFTAIEYVMYRLNGFEYFHGWNILCSFFFDIVLFFILWLHHKKPVLAWLCIALIVPIFLLISGFPMDKII